MKTITFIYPQMVMGGAEKVLIRLIENIDRTKYKINVILLRHGGELEHSFPPDVSVCYADSIPLLSPLKKLNVKQFTLGGYYRLRIRLAKSYEEKSYWSVKVCKIPETIAADCVICFSHYNFMSICIAAQSNAPCKILWCHSTFRENRNQKLYEKMLKHFNAFFCVSRSSKTDFDKCFPQFSDKSEVVYNLIDKDKIISQSLKKCPDNLQYPALVTVGRLDEQKGLLLVPQILKKLLDNGYDAHWYLVGEGELRKELERQISEYGLQEHLVLVGNQENPYPYMRQCDIYVQPSKNEGFCTASNEARILQKPIVASNIPSFQEQLTNGENGFLVEQTVDGFYEGIVKLLERPDISREFIDNLKYVGINNQKQLEKLYAVLKY